MKQYEDQLITKVVTKPEAQDKEPRHIAYFASWSSEERALGLMDIDPSILTHINYAFANLTEDGEVFLSDVESDTIKDKKTVKKESKEDSHGYFAQIKQIKEKYPHLKVLISIGGWTWSTNFSGVAADPIKRNRFAASALELVVKYGSDGVDIDWEYPGEGGDNIPHHPADNKNFVLLLKAIRKAMNEQAKKDGKNYLLSIAARAAKRFVTDSNLLEAMQFIDFINLMTYDFHSVSEKKTAFNAPLFEKDEKSESIGTTITAFIEAGIDPKAINLGLAFYGKGWTNVASTKNHGVYQPAEAISGIGYGLGTWEPGAFEAWDILENYVDKNGFVRYFDETAQCPYLFDGKTWIGYDDEESIKVKIDFAKEKGLGGVMFWEFSGDKNLTLQKSIAELLGNSNK